MLQHLIFRRRLFAFLMVDAHFLLALAACLGQRRPDGAFMHFGNPDRQGKIDFLDVAPLENRAKLLGCLGAAGQQQHAARVLVQPVHKARPHALVVGQTIQEAIDMPLHIRASLRGKAGRLVQGDNIRVLENHQ